MIEKRKRPILNVASIPEELKSHRQWVFWKLEMRKEKPAKIPYQVNGRRADSTTPRTWAMYEDVVQFVWNNPHVYNGIGYVFAKDDGYTGVDMDKCIDKDGQISKVAQEMICILDSYTEKSQSGEGLHIIVKGKKPWKLNRKGKFEMYDQDRYFCFTGDHLEGTPTVIREN
ncbi:hypothetical protein [Desulfosporosinus sp. FKA]|uniref:hypothetical protein n=1 Tax=Desulfosporosinus sp. FKA TaxID=1969834 RepID=UPI0011251397|nr:hypothetical protein [Desulfosporosinus sp. FKA]